jgi:hypothetical protein
LDNSKTVFTIGVHIFILLLILFGASYVKKNIITGVIENMHPRCSEEFENHNLHTVKVACRLISLLDLTSSISSVVLVLLIARGNCLSVVELLLFTFEMCARRLLSFELR